MLWDSSPRIENASRNDTRSSAEAFAKRPSGAAEPLRSPRSWLHGGESSRSSVRGFVTRPAAPNRKQSLWDTPCGSSDTGLQGVEREIARHAAAAEQLGNLAPAEQMAGQLGDYLHPKPELAPVLDRVWREWLELPVVRTTTLSPEQIERLAGLDGRIRLVAAADAPSVRTLPTPKGAEDLLLQAGIESEHLGWVARSLPRTLRCDDLDRARELADELPDAVIVCGDGVVRKGRILEPTTRGDRHPGALQLRTMEKELNSEIAGVSARTDELTGRHQEAAGRLDDQSNQLASLDSEVVSAEQERARTATIEESLIQELGRVERELDSLATEEDRSRSLGRGDRPASYAAGGGSFKARGAECRARAGGRGRRQPPRRPTRRNRRRLARSRSKAGRSAALRRTHRGLPSGEQFASTRRRESS